jgi:hypothetical protein
MELTEQEQQLIDAIRENANDERSATRIRAMAISVIGKSVAPRCWWRPRPVEFPPRVGALTVCADIDPVPEATAG